jgi:tetratricopeptide (TPR) repeat protein
MMTPDLERLFQTYLERQIANPALETSIGEAIPHQAGQARPLDARQCWEAALAPLRLLSPSVSNLAPPAEWAALISELEPIAGLACAVGNFPQLVGPLESLFKFKRDVSRSPSGPILDSASLAVRGEKANHQRRQADSILAIGLLRLARHYERAQSMLEELSPDIGEEWLPALANEAAALAWHRGNTQEATALWNQQSPSIPVLFNRGMAALFLGRPIEARDALAMAVAGLPEENSWNHLGRLYLALAEAAS